MTTEKFTKETFTKDEILFDLLAVEQKINRRGGEAYLYAIIPCAVLAFLVGILLHNVWLALAFSAVALLHIIRMIPLAVRSHMMRKTLKDSIENDRFSLTSERLQSIEEQDDGPLFRFEGGTKRQMPRLSEH